MRNKKSEASATSLTLKGSDRGELSNAKNDNLTNELTASEIYNICTLKLFYLKFFEHVFKKYGFDRQVIIQKHEIYSLLGSLFAFRRPETRTFLRSLTHTFSFVSLKRDKLIIEVTE